MERELRRRRSILSITGMGVIALGLWSFIKLNLYFLAAQNATIEGLGLADLSADERRTSFLFLYVVGLVLAVLELILRIYIGRSAIRDAKGAKKKSLYLVFAAILASLSAIYLCLDITSFDFHSNHVADSMASILVEITSLYIFIELLFAAIKIRLLRKNTSTC